MIGAKYKRVHCADGFNMSVQAGPHSYSSPKDDMGPYVAVEVGFPSEEERPHNHVLVFSVCLFLLTCTRNILFTFNSYQAVSVEVIALTCIILIFLVVFFVSY